MCIIVGNSQIIIGKGLELTGILTGEVRLLVCQKCSNWKCEELKYEEAVERWADSIGGIVTPGILKRYKKEAARQDEDISQIRIGFKYCAKGILTRFYIRRGENECRPVRTGEGCPKFTKGNPKMEQTVWQICATESHGPSEVNGIRFCPGLYENHTYMRIPSYGSVRPTVETGGSECSSCGKVARRSIRVRVEKTFCCNKHYLEWWAEHYREEFRRLER